MSESALVERERPMANTRLKKEEFDAQYHFRESREHCNIRSPVCCASCKYMSGVPSGKGEAHCNHPARFRKTLLIEPCGFFESYRKSIASTHVCSAFEAREKLPADVVVPALPEKHHILLGTQWNDVEHVDIHCPYVVEELRMARHKSQHRAEVHIFDRSQTVVGEVIHPMCEMPCCAKTLDAYQTYQIDSYRRAAGIKPDGSEPRRLVRNGITKHGLHGRVVDLSFEEAEKVFDLTEFNSEKYKGVHNQISAAQHHLHINSNWLGSRPLGEAKNPVAHSNCHHALQPSWDARPPFDLKGSSGFWMYDSRLFNGKEITLSEPVELLESIPEGLSLWRDTQGILAHPSFDYGHERLSLGGFWFYGILRPVEDITLRSKGLEYFVDVRAVEYHKDRCIGVFGNGYRGIASFHEQ